MSSPATDPSALAHALRRPRLAGLAVLAICAIWTGVLSASEGETGAVDRGYVLTALALACISIFARSSALGSQSVQRMVALHGLSCAAAAGLGLLGLALALRDGEASIGLLYCVAGALFLLRPATRFVAPRPAEPFRRD